MHDAMVALFATAAGFTTSGIVANAYRMLAADVEAPRIRASYVVIVALAGPIMLFEKAARAWRDKSCSWPAFWLAAAVASYWSLALGLFVIQIALAL